MTTYIWKSKYDYETVHIGRDWLHTKDEDGYSIMFTGHIDSLQILGFTNQDFERLTTEPQEIEFKGVTWND